MEDLHTLQGGRFLIQRQLGEGGMGVVYQALDIQRGSVVALKTLKGLNPVGLMLFKNEFRALVDLSHPNLIELYEFFSEDGLYFFTMELLQGGEFLDYLRGEQASRESALTPFDEQPTDQPPQTPRLVAPSADYNEARLRESFRQLAMGLHTLHRANKIHRDIKPSNVMVVDERRPAEEKRKEEREERQEESGGGPLSTGLSPLSFRVVLMDFGLITETSETRGQSVGTPLYMAPEQALGQPLGPAADWYSVGVMLYQALTGVLPFSGSWTQLIRQKQATPTPPRELLPQTPTDLSELCMALLRPAPEERPSGDEVLRALSEASPAALAVQRSHASFVGRQRELSLLTASLSESRAGPVLLQVVYGESGLGKSVLVKHFLKGLVAEKRARVFSGRCYEQEQVPYKAFDGIIDSLCRYFLTLELREIAPLLPADIELLARVFPVLRQVRAIEQVSSHQPQQDPNELRSRALAALHELFSNMAQQRPLVLFMDDLQWTDKDSLLLLDSLLQSASGAYLLIATARGSKETLWREGGPLGALTERKSALRHLQLPRLPDEDARSLIQALSPRSQAEIEGLLQEAKGHPLFLQELTLHHEETQREGGEIARLDDILFARINRLEPKTRALLELIAVAGAPIEQRLLIQAAQSTPAEFTSQVSLLRRGLLIRTMGRQETHTIEPYHDRVRETVASRLEGLKKREHHLRLAEVMEAAQGEPHALLRHLEAAGEQRRAAAYAQHAASLARSALAFDQAAEFLKTALRLGGYGAEARRLLQRSLAESLADAGRNTEAAEEFLGAAQGVTPTESFECRRLAAAHLLAAGHLDRGLQITGEVLRELGERLLSAQTALPAILWYRLRLELRGTAHRLVQEDRAPAKELLRLDIYRDIIQGISPISPPLAAAYSCKQLLLALEVGEPRRLSYALTGAIGVFAMEGPTKIARCYELLSLLKKSHQELDAGTYHQGQSALAKALIRYAAQGHIASALRAAKEAEALFVQLPEASKPLATVRSLRAGILGFHQGDYLGLKTWGQQILQDAIRRKDRYSTFSFIHQGSIALLAEDNPEALRQQLTESSWPAPEHGYQMQHMFELRAHGDLALYEGRAAELLPALRRHRKMLPLSLRSSLSMASIFWLLGARVCLASAKGPLDPLLREARAYIEQLESTGLTFARNQARLMRAGLAARQGEPQQAIELLRGAIPPCQEEEMYDSTAAARYRLGQLLGGQEGASQRALGQQQLSQLGASRPERMVEVITPGFDKLI